MDNFEDLLPKTVEFEFDKCEQLMQMLRQDADGPRVWPSQLAKVMAGDYCLDKLANPEPWKENVYTIAGKIAHKAIELRFSGLRDSSGGSVLSVATAKIIDRCDIEGVDIMEAKVRASESFTLWFDFVKGYDTYPGLPLINPRTEAKVSTPNLSGSIDFMSGHITDGTRETPPGKLVSSRLIIDWKTGRRKDTDFQQLALYALMHVSKYGVPPARVACVYLNGTRPHVEYQDIDIDTLFQVYSNMQAAMVIARSVVQGPGLNDRSACSECRFCHLDCHLAG